MDFSIRVYILVTSLIGMLTILTMLFQPEMLSAKRFLMAFLSAIFTAPIVAFLSYLIWSDLLTVNFFVRVYLVQVVVVYILNPKGASPLPFTVTHVKDGHPFKIYFNKN